MALWDEVTHWDGHWGGVHTVVVTDASVHDMLRYGRLITWG